MYILCAIYFHSFRSINVCFKTLGTGVVADTTAGRIMELSKKNTGLTADLESVLLGTKPLVDSIGHFIVRGEERCVTRQRTAA